MRRTRPPLLRRLAGAALVLFAVGLASAACDGCHATPHATSVAEAKTPTVRLYVVSNLAGALEPCGCTKHQLGGMDHLAAFVASQRALAPASLLVAAGPTLFMDPKLDEARGTQDAWKAETIGASLGGLGLVAWAPGANDWAAGADALAKVAAASKGKLVAANLSSAAGAAGATAGAVATALREVGGVKVGVVGVSVPLLDGQPPPGVNVGEAAEAFTKGIAELEKQGAQLLVGAAAMPRGEALRLADRVPKLAVLVVGKPSDAGEANDAPAPPQLVGKTLVVQTSNHLQTVGVVDFFVRGASFDFADGSGVAHADELAAIDERMRELETRIAAWEKGGDVSAADLDARKRDLAKMREDRAKLAAVAAPPSGSFFRWQLAEVTDELGRDQTTFDEMLAFYKRVNEHNKTALAGRKPPPVPPGGSAYVGIEVCSSCHEQERKVWDRTPHAHAYETLAKEFKEYNLECVSCHVTGYEQPGGSTVTMNASLRDVQCEQCHGPGQAHVKDPDKKGLVRREPKLELCTSSCHHPPHVEGFDPKVKVKRILGPGHGMPDDAPWPAWANEKTGG